MQKFAQQGGLAALSDTAGVRIVRGAGGNWQHAGPGRGNLVLGRGRRSDGSSSCTSEGEDDDNSADEVFHSGIPLKLYLLKKISLDKAYEVTIG